MVLLVTTKNPHLDDVRWIAGAQMRRRRCRQGARQRLSFLRVVWDAKRRS
jgi:hypothetical protein